MVKPAGPGLSYLLIWYWRPPRNRRTDVGGLETTANEARLAALRARLSDHIKKTAHERLKRVRQLIGRAREAAERVLDVRPRSGANGNT
jgi:hypothetical protein